MMKRARGWEHLTHAEERRILERWRARVAGWKYSRQVMPDFIRSLYTDNIENITFAHGRIWGDIDDLKQVCIGHQDWLEGEIDIEMMGY